MISTWTRKTTVLLVTIATAFAAAGCDNNGESASMASPSPSIATETTTASTPIPSASSPIEEINVRVDQLGYLPEGPKIVVVSSDESFGEMTLQIVDKNNNDKPVWEGTMPAATIDTYSGEWVSQADFGKLQAEGSYEAVAGGNHSDPFFIKLGVYDDLLYKVSRSYTTQRANQAIDDPVTGLKLLAGHKQDEQAKLFFEDKGQPSVLDVRGGWYDAGDFGKYMPTAAITVGQMLLAFEENPAPISVTRFLSEEEKAFWPTSSSAPDILTEIKYELDWMLRMQRGDGAVYHKVSGMAFPSFILPAEDIQDRYVYGMSSFGTAMFTAATAMGARVYEPYDKDYAAELLRRSKLAQTWLDRNPKAYFRNDEGQNSGSGPYDKSSDREERFWALAELYKTTGDSAYEEVIGKKYSDLAEKPPGIVGWGNAQLLGQWAVATAANSPSTVHDTAINAIVQAADGIVNRIGEDGYRNSLTTNDYNWGSNKNALAYGELLLLANKLKPSEAYVNGALDQLHYVLGRNAMGMSYVTGVGSRYPLKPHHRISMMSGVKVPGLLVGGPNKFGNDEALAQLVQQGVPPALSYIDDVSSYSSNEYAIDYNAPLFFVLTAFSH
ncbi:glycoside hydrolase family 9 protein [Cohnella yongneupensis]|uniref:Endoglucanase n=1 Tax=Cohnella yongneupensis TaxID=425006 RepID=A0ABW0R137_9BACL